MNFFFVSGAKLKPTKIWSIIIKSWQRNETLQENNLMHSLNKNENGVFVFSFLVSAQTAEMNNKIVAFFFKQPTSIINFP